MVRGRCPRDRIRWVADVTVRTVGNAGKIGHAERPQPPHPGSHANAGRRGRRPLRAVCLLYAAACDVRAQHLVRAHRRYPSSQAGRAWKPAPTVAGKASASHPRRHQPLSRGAVRRDSSPFRGAKGVGAAQPRYSFTHAARNPSVTAQCAVTAPLSGEPRVGGGGWPCASAFRDIGVRRAGAVYVQSPRMGAGFFIRFTLPPAAFCPCAGRGRW